MHPDLLLLRGVHLHRHWPLGRFVDWFGDGVLHVTQLHPRA